MSDNTVRVAVTDKYIYVRAPFALKDKFNEITGARYSAPDQAYRMPVSASTMAEILQAFKGCKVLGSGNYAPLVEQVKAMKQASAAKEADVDTLPPIPVTNPQFPPWEHQLRLFHYAYKMPAVYVNVGMGGGKSRSLVDMVQNRNHKRVLIVCPPSVVDVWPKEFRKHAQIDVNVVPLSKKAGSVEKRVEIAKKQLELGKARNVPTVIVINFESVWREPFDKFALKAGFDFVIADEAHRGKSPSGKASMFLAKLGAKVPFRWAMSGTPMPHDPLDIQPQYKFLDPGIFGTSFSMFKQKFGMWGGFENKKFLGMRPELLDEFNRKMYSIMFRVPQEELDKKLGLIEPVHVERYCELGTEAARVYKELEKDMIAGIADGSVTVANALTKLLRHQQLTGGFVTDDEKNVRQIDTAKRDLLEEVLEDIGYSKPHKDDKERPPVEPVVVFCQFTSDLDAVRQLTESFGRKYAELSGRQNDLEDGTMPSWCDVMAVQIKAGSAGVDLTRSCYAVYYSVGFNLGDYEQSLKRPHRKGQERKVTYIHLIAQGTVDEKVYKALSERKQIVEHVLEELKR